MHFVRKAETTTAETVGAGRGTVREVLIGQGEAPHFQLRRFRMEPGGGMPRHTNAVEHEQYVLRGRGRIELGDEVHEVGPGDVVFIPAGVPHSYASIGEEPFEFLCAVPNLPDRIDMVEKG